MSESILAHISTFLPFQHSIFNLTWHYGFLALMALGGILVGVALSTEELLILGGEGLIHQGAFALEAFETVLMPVTVLVGQILQEHRRDTSRLGPLGSFRHVQLCIAYPGITANGLLAVLTGVGVQTLVTLHTVGVLLSQNILLSKQGLLAIVAVVTLSHFHLDGTT